MRKLSSLSLVKSAAACTLVVVVVAVALAQPQSSSADKEEQRVEEAADQVMKRFYETLDFEPIWKEKYVSNPSLRAEEVLVVMFELLWDSKEKIAYEDQERAYIAQKSFQLLFSALAFTAPKAVTLEQLAKELKGPYESITRIKKPITSAADLERRFTRVNNHMNGILRRYVSREAYDSAEYKARAKNVIEDQPEETRRLREIFEPVGLSADTKIYVARREMFYLYFIKEGDAFRLLTLSGRRRH